MRRRLRLHPGSRSVADAVHVEARRNGSHLDLDYRIEGDVDRIHFPPSEPSRRTDRLWEHTCLEAFLKAPGRPSYFELNFAPSRLWAAYGFTSRRQGMNPIEIVPPMIVREHGPSLFRLRVSVELEKIAELAEADSWEVGISAVLEELEGTRSFWAIAHPEGPPDFHHEHCFQGRLAAAPSP